MKTSIQTLLTAFVVVVILASSATTFTSCAKKEDPAPTTTTTSTLTFPGITSYTGKVLGDQANTALGSYFATSNGSVYLSGDFATNVSSIDLWFFSDPRGTPTTPTLSSPSERAAEGFTTNTTGGINYIGDAPSNINFASLTAGRLDSMAAPSTKQVAVGTTVPTGVYSFKNAAGKKGVIKVTAVNFGATSANNTVTIDVKVQQ